MNVLKRKRQQRLEKIAQNEVKAAVIESTDASQQKNKAKVAPVVIAPVAQPRKKKSK